MAFISSQRGYVQQWSSGFRVVPYVTKQGAPIKTRATYLVENGEPGRAERLRLFDPGLAWRCRVGPALGNSGERRVLEQSWWTPPVDRAEGALHRRGFAVAGSVSGVEVLGDEVHD